MTKLSEKIEFFKIKKSIFDERQLLRFDPICDNIVYIKQSMGHRAELGAKCYAF